MPALNPQYVGVGAYSLAQASRMLGVQKNTLRHWAGEIADREGVITRRFPDDRILTFAELMELHFVKMFRDEDVSLQVIRKAALAAAKRFDTEHPFSVKRFDTDGKQIFATLTRKETDEELVEDLARGQLVFQQIIRPFFKKLEYGASQQVGLFWPMSKRGRVVLNPRRNMGQPIDHQTGVPVATLISAVANGEDPKRVAKWYDVPLEAVKAAVKYDRSLTS